MVTLVQLTGAAWPAAALAFVCRLHVVAVWLAAQVSDEKRIRGVVRYALYKLTPFYLYPSLTLACAGLFEPKGSALGLLKSLFNAENYICRFFWSTFRHFIAVHS